MCVIYVIWLCASRIGLGWAHDAIFLCMSHVHAFPCIRTLLSIYIFIYLNCFETFLSVSFSSPHSLVYVSALWHQNVSLLRLETLFVSGHLLLLLIPPPLLFGSVMSKPERISRKTFLDEAFIQNAKSFCWTSLTLTYPLSLTIGVGSHYVMSRSPIHSC